jgi:aldose 1-epimerase
LSKGLNPSASCLFTLMIAILPVATFSRDRESSQAPSPPHESIQQEAFGELPDGRPVSLFRLNNGRGMSVAISDFGGAIVSIQMPDRKGRSDEIVLGYDNLDGYLKNPMKFGVLLGRYANRIAQGRFMIGGQQFRTTVNAKPHTLHGGLNGFDKVLWKASASLSPDGPRIVLAHTSPDGSEGFPGTLEVRVTYTLTRMNDLHLEICAKTDRPTVLSISNHTYFNLEGIGGSDNRNHRVQLFSDRYTPSDATGIPFSIKKVEGTPLDMRSVTLLKENIDRPSAEFPEGIFNHNYLSRSEGEDGCKLIAMVEAPRSGRRVEVRSTYPAFQFFTPRFERSLKGRTGENLAGFSGFAIEPQHVPNSPNNPLFPTSLLLPGQTFRQSIIYSFSWK